MRQCGAHRRAPFIFMIRSNPHTHTTYVDGRSSAREMAQKAVELGFTSLGFSEHAAQEDFDAAYGLRPKDRAAYLAEIRALAREFAPSLTIRAGLEIDRLSTDTTDALDYFYAANHYFRAEDGAWAAVDGDADALERFVNGRFGGCWDRALEVYFDEYAGFVERIRPTIIAHFDLICKGNRKKHWFSETEGALLDCGRAAMDRMIRVCDLMEVNTGGMARSAQPCPYPIQPLLSYWHTLGGRVIPASDCHRSWQLDAAFDTVEEYLRGAGFSRYTVLGSGETLFETVEL